MTILILKATEPIELQGDCTPWQECEKSFYCRWIGEESPEGTEQIGEGNEMYLLPDGTPLTRFAL